MDTLSSPRSPKRRRILVSINPATTADDDNGHLATSSRRRRRTASPEDEARPTAAAPWVLAPQHPKADGGGSVPDGEPQADNGKEDNSHAPSPAPRPIKFRFKSTSSRHGSSRRRSKDGEEDGEDRQRRHRRRRREETEAEDARKDQAPTTSGAAAAAADDESESRHRRSDRHRRHHHRSSHRRRHRSPSPPVAEAEPPLDPEAAFRESLFDAMADDEGAAYWEGVYGQPIHVYSPERVNGATGELERMTDEEYAAHVRQKMWEKTHTGLMEERARRERARAEAQKREEEARRIQAEMERSLRRGEERRKKRAYRDRWDGYVQAWAAWEGSGGGGGVAGIPWPGRANTTSWSSGSEKSTIEEEKIRAFFVNGLDLEALGEKDFSAKLKEERVRWHPDKMQQKLGGCVDAATMRDITAIFQVIDRLWNDTRKSAA
ncbi:hypothetical protein B0H63DRAFT_268332 [Podospora didyma]|uniref:J domain-containing protein n=1 Tax=Podospora didyma TaxID=330526 RepID=A0AAE0KFA2_9PEZI|nr:hypothetical protein B0H63DRAFT_268332 [Podospora didyma]